MHVCHDSYLLHRNPGMEQFHVREVSSDRMRQVYNIIRFPLAELTMLDPCRVIKLTCMVQCKIKRWYVMVGGHEYMSLFEVPEF